MEGRAHGEAASDVGEDVDAPETGADGGHGLFQPPRVDQVDGEGRALAETGPGRLQGFGMTAEEGDARPPGGEGLADRPTEIAGGAGDDGDLACEFGHEWLSREW